MKTTYTYTLPEVTDLVVELTKRQLELANIQLDFSNKPYSKIDVDWVVEQGYTAFDKPTGSHYLKEVRVTVHTK